MTIYKYPGLSSDKGGDRQSLNLPDGARVLHCDYQYDALTLWALVDPNAIPSPRHFRVFGTGWEMGRDTKSLAYVSTVFQGPYVWHIFEDFGEH